jgi:type III secretion system-like peptide-binding chaperone
VTKARAALDAWLEEADRVLADQRKALLSPSQALGDWDDHKSVVTSTVSEVGRCLGRLLRRYTRAPGRWIVIIREPEVPGYYVQFICYEDGALVAEAVSNHYLPEALWLTGEQQDALTQLGWTHPDPPEVPNWVTVHPTIDPPVSEVARRAIKTLKVLGMDPESALVLKIFTSPMRRNGPLLEPDQPRAQGWTSCDDVAVA